MGEKSTGCLKDKVCSPLVDLQGAPTPLLNDPEWSGACCEWHMLPLLSMES